MLLALFSLLTVSAFAQSKVNGTVNDASGQPLPGVSVSIKGTTIGMMTDANGKFSLNSNTPDATLVISFIGYNTKELKVKGGDNINIQLTSADRSLSEVVVVGYGTQRKGDVTGSVATVKADNFVQGAARDAAELLRGKVAGLTVSSPSGDPTQGGEVYLRGINSLSGNQSPLVLIDGVPGDLRTVPPEDIAQIDVLKDGASSAIYGTRATNGVILITTKKSNGQSSVQYSGYVSTEQFVKTPDLLTADEFRQANKAHNIAFTDYGGNTNWVKEISRTPFTQVQDLTIKGGSATTNFLANLNYRGFEGMFKGSDDRTIIGRLSINHSMFNNMLKLNLNYNSNNDSYETTGDGYSFNNSIYHNALISNPTLPVYKSQVSPTVLANNPAYNGQWAQPSAFIGIPNPLSSIEEGNGVNTSQRNRIYGSLTFDPVSYLTFKASLSTDRFNQLDGYKETFDNFNTTVEQSRNGYASRSSTQIVDNLAEFTGEYHKQIGKSNITALAGYGYESDVTQGFYAQNWNFPTDAFDWNNLGLGRANSATAGQAIPEGSSKSSWNLISFFGRVNYNYDDKYLATVSVRREADSRFLGSSQPWGTFPAASVGWRINKESFLEDVKAINDLKLRFGYGITGVAPTTPYLADYRLGYSSNSNTFLYNGQWINLLQPASNPNPDFTWERKHEFNLGLDYSLFNNRVNGTIDAYSRKVTDLLYNYPVPVPPNTYGTTYANVGTLKNKGLEVLVNIIPVQNTNFQWTTTLTFSTNQNTMGNLNNNKYSLGSDYFTLGSAQAPINNETTNIVQVGKPLGEIYGWKAIGVDNNGKWIYEGANGQPVSSANVKASDRQVLGNGIPKYFAGWNNNFHYKQFDLGITMRGQFDYQIIDFTRMHMENFLGNPSPNNNLLKSSLNTVYGKTLNDALAFNSYYVENGDFWKVDNITLGYNFKPIGKVIKGLRIYASTLNTFCITKYKGLDPEISLLGNANGLAAGTDDWNKYPTSRVFTLGLNVTL